MKENEKQNYEFIIKQLQHIRNDIAELNDKLDLLNEDSIRCDNCKSIVPEECITKTEHDGNICEQCLVDGYGK